MEREGLDGFEYIVDHTPWGLAQGADIELSLRESDDGRHTRRVLRWHSAVKDGERRLSISLVHQRRNPASGGWADEHFDRRRLSAGEEVALDLDSDETRKLVEHLDALRQVNERLGVERGVSYMVHREGEVVVPQDLAQVLEQLRASSDPETVARNLATIAPDLASAAGIIQLHRVRAEALDEFRQHLDDLDWSERDWQGFFERNDWIFGHGLDYRFLVTEETHPTYGGSNITGRGDQQGNFFMGTVGDSRFAVLVEIKRPDTDLVEGDRYRNGAWRASEHLAGGVAQVQANCQQWQVASRQYPDSEWAAEHDITTAAPEGVLVIGRTSSLTAREQRESFERFRNHLWNPKVIAYDELYARASFIVTRLDDGPAPEPEPEPEPDRSWEDYLPF